MQQLKCTVESSRMETDTVLTVRFRPSQKINFIAGQFLQIIFDEQNLMNRELNKFVSFSCAPELEYFEITKRLSTSEFSNRLKALKSDEQVLIKLPLGNCVLENPPAKHIAFLIGGIGITPARSIIQYIETKKMPITIKLFYANRNSNDIAFKAEFDEIAEKNPNFQVYYFVSECAPDDKTCILGAIQKEEILTRIDDIHKYTFYIFGPPKMVVAMQNICKELGCAKEKVKLESFMGY